MQNEDIVVTSSDQESNAARESQKEATAAAEQPKPEAGKEPEQKVEAGDAAEGGDDGDDAQNESGDSADREPGDAPAQPRRKRPTLQDRIDELTKARYDAEREREYWRAQALVLQQHQQKPTAEPDQAPAAHAAAGAEDVEPTLESCDFDQVEFTRKWYEWRRRQDEKVAQQQQRQAVFQEKVSAFRAEHPDYDQVACNPALPITQTMADVILETEDPPAVAYYLGKNPTEAAAIAQMTPVQIARAIGRIEAKLSAPTTAPQPAQPAPPKTASKAPPPVTTLSGAPSTPKSYEDMTQEEYEQARREERRARGLRP